MASESTLIMQKWLESINMSEYLNNFVADGWDCMSSLLFMTDDDLKSIGIQKAGHHRRLMHEIEKHRIGTEQGQQKETVTQPIQLPRPSFSTSASTQSEGARRRSGTVYS